MSAGTRRAVFLDRDGTLLATDQHLGDPGMVALVPGAAECAVEAAWVEALIGNWC